MKKGFYFIENKNLFEKRVWQAKSNGFKWAIDFPNGDLSFERAKSMFHRNSKLLLHLFHNDITGKDEMQVTTATIIKTYPQYKGKVLEIL